jgi:hypothetical protein
MLRLLTAVLALPWTLAIGAVRLLITVVTFPWRVRARAAVTIDCPAGHPNTLMGRWSCSCGAAYMGHVFGPCPICGMPAGWMRCEVCGLAIRSPWKDE